MKKFYQLLFIISLIIPIILISLSAMFQWDSMDFFPGLSLVLEEEFSEDTIPAVEDTVQEEIDMEPTFSDQLLEIALHFSSLLTILMISIFITYMFPKRMQTISEQFNRGFKNFQSMFFLGLMGIILMLILIFGSTLTFVTVPVILVIIIFLLLTTWVGFITPSLQIGRFLQNKSGWFQNRPIIALAIGHLVLFSLMEVPLLNILVYIILVSLGLGSVIKTNFGTNRPWSLSVLKEGNQ